MQLAARRRFSLVRLLDKANNGGIPVDVPAMTVNRVCGSGAQAMVSAAQEVMLGMLDGAIADGMENMDLAPYLLGGGRWAIG